MAKGLRSCPFCGGKASVSVWPGRDGACMAAIECPSCGARGPAAEARSFDRAAEMARERWNTRVKEGEWTARGPNTW